MVDSTNTGGSVAARAKREGGFRLVGRGAESAGGRQASGEIGRKKKKSRSRSSGKPTSQPSVETSTQNSGAKAPSTPTQKSIQQIADDIKKQKLSSSISRSDLQTPDTRFVQPPTVKTISQDIRRPKSSKPTVEIQKEPTSFLGRPAENIRSSITGVRQRVEASKARQAELNIQPFQVTAPVAFSGVSGVLSVPGFLKPTAKKVVAFETGIQKTVTGLPGIKQVIGAGTKTFQKLPGKAQTLVSGAKTTGVAFGEALFVSTGVKKATEFALLTPQEKKFLKQEGVSDIFREARSEAKFQDGLFSGIASEALPPVEIRKDKGDASTLFQQKLLAEGKITSDQLGLAKSAAEKRLRAEVIAETTILPLLERRTEVAGRTSRALGRVASGVKGSTKKFFTALPTFAALSALEAGSQSLAVQKVRGGDLSGKEFGIDVGAGVLTGSIISTNIFNIKTPKPKLDLSDFKISDTPIKTPTPEKIGDVTFGDVKPALKTDVPIEKLQLENVGRIGSPFEEAGDILTDFGESLRPKARRPRGTRAKVRSTTFPSIASQSNAEAAALFEPITKPTSDSFVEPSVEPFVQVPSDSSVFPFVQTGVVTDTASKVNPFVQAQASVSPASQVQPSVFTGQFPTVPFFPGGGSGRGINLKLFKASRPSKNVADVASSLFGIRGKTSKASVFTGLGLRPLQEATRKVNNNGRSRRKRKLK